MGYAKPKQSNQPKRRVKWTAQAEAAAEAAAAAARSLSHPLAVKHEVNKCAWTSVWRAGHRDLTKALRYPELKLKIPA